MAIAKLSIDLVAGLASLQTGLDKAAAISQASAGRIEKAFGGLKNIGAGLLGGISVTAIAALAKRTIDGIDALNDLSDATGASIENLSALEDIALRTGTSMETAGDAIVKMNKALSDAKPGSDMAKVFQALGLSLADLKKLDPVEAFQKLAIALSNFADDGNKARIVQEIFGKSLKQVAPLLKDAAEAGKLNATVTTEQAKAAEAFNKQFFALQKNATDLARAVVGDLVPALNKYLESLERARTSGADIFGAELVSEAQAARLKFAVAKVEDLQAALAKDPGNRGLSEALTRARADADQLLKTATSANNKLRAMVALPAQSPEDAKSAFLRGDKDTTKPSLPDLPTGTNRALKSAADERVKLAEFAAEQIVKLEEITAQETAEAWSYVNKSVIDDGEARAEAYKTQWKQVFEFIDAEQDRAIEEGQALIDASKHMAENAKQVGDAMALVFSSAAGEAITKFEDLRGVLKGIAADIAQIAIRETIVKPLNDVLSGALKGFSLASLFGSAKGNAFGPAGVIPFASGGVVTGPTLFKFANGTGLMGEAGPEAIMPLKRGRDGKLGVSGSGGITYAPVINIDSRSDRAQVAAMVSAAVAQGQQQMLQHLQAQGAV